MHLSTTAERADHVQTIPISGARRADGGSGRGDQAPTPSEISTKTAGPTCPTYWPTRSSAFSVTEVTDAVAPEGTPQEHLNSLSRLTRDRDLPGVAMVGKGGIIDGPGNVP